MGNRRGELNYDLPISLHGTEDRVQVCSAIALSLTEAEPTRVIHSDGPGKLDTSLKRHTALLVKLRSSLNTAAQIPAILKDIAGLSLEKYVEEAVGAVVEGLGKCKTGPEAVGAVEVSSFDSSVPIQRLPR